MVFSNLNKNKKISNLYITTYKQFDDDHDDYDKDLGDKDTTDGSKERNRPRRTQSDGNEATAAAAPAHFATVGQSSQKFYKLKSFLRFKQCFETIFNLSFIK